MKCEVCGSETPPHYQQNSLAAIICHTCKSLGRFVQGLVVDSQPPAAQIEPPAPAEETVQVSSEPVEESMPTGVPSKPAIESPVQTQDAKTDEDVQESVQDTTSTTPKETKKKTTKL